MGLGELRLGSEEMRLEMPPRGQKAEGRNLYFVSDLLTKRS